MLGIFKDEKSKYENVVDLSHVPQLAFIRVTYWLLGSLHIFLPEALHNPRGISRLQSQGSPTLIPFLARCR